VRFLRVSRQASGHARAHIGRHIARAEVLELDIHVDDATGLRARGSGRAMLDLHSLKVKSISL
jgi:hypothetical protein